MVHVDKAHLLLQKISPQGYIFAILMSLKHGNSLLLNWGIKNRWTIAVNQSQGGGKSKMAAWICQLPDKPHFFFFFDGLKPSLATGLMPP